MPALTAQQMDAIRSLEWLYDNVVAQRTGRSLAVAIALVRVALRYPGQPIDIRDHLPRRGPRSFEEVTRNIERMLGEDALLASVFLIRGGRLTIDRDVLVDADTWLPRGWSPPPVQERNSAVLGGSIADIPPPTKAPVAPEPQTTLWDYLQDPTF